jgi:hypothetical protein
MFPHQLITWVFRFCGERLFSAILRTSPPRLPRMALRLLPWAPEYGTAMQFDAEEVSGADGREATTDPTIEGPWQAVAPSGPVPGAVQIIDGVRRAEAHGMDEDADGAAVFGLFGSLAVGAVRLEPTGARLLDGSFRVARRYLQTGGEPVAREVSSGAASLRFAPEIPDQAHTSNDLVAALNRLMLDEEARLAESLSRDESTLTFVDGPLRLRAPGQRVVGYIKRIHRWYLDPEHQLLLPRLRPGERTPLFRIVEAGHERTSWYLRLADLRTHFHPLAGLLRLEVPGPLPLADAAALADQSARVLPMLASSPVRDPRSPQNLIPVGALESALTHRLGDRRWVSRLITATVGRESAEALP